jgi:hypothetical protein
VRAEVTPHFLVSAFGEEVKIHLTEERPVVIRVVCWDGIAFVLNVDAIVRDGLEGHDADPHP